MSSIPPVLHCPNCGSKDSRKKGTTRRSKQTDKCRVRRWRTAVDGSVIRVHQHAAGARGSTAEAEALGHSQGGFGGGRARLSALKP